MNDDLNWLADGLRTHTAALASAAAGLGPDAAVPTCPKWQVRNLVGHIGQAHRWAAGIARTGATSAPPDPLTAEPGTPQDWPAWLAAGVAELVDAVTESGPDRPVWTYVGELPARFWLRRMLHDTVVHSADAAMAAGIEFTVAPDIAADTITELLEIMCDPTVPRLKPELANLRGAGQTLQLRPSDAGPGWLITRTPTGPTWTRAADDADLVVAAPIRDLLLVLFRRTSPDAVARTGEAALLDQWLATTSF
ncbi:MAG TPA: maleylpyruvate isomerase family mycothiol-dependent enzyme [Pseudonocardiaceae bacterium]|jgi:uncharacterized protein (TIGR03083 family)|nr:maleylpyruvate isomerase family mycothiol-dependent enzyme [Pseudonocardiaceae bacterium]